MSYSKEITERVFRWGYNDIAPINAIHRARMKYDKDRLYRVKNCLKLVLAKDKKTAVTILNKDYGSIVYKVKDIVEYRDE
jgi:hypothetical protein